MRALVPLVACAIACLSTPAQAQHQMPSGTTHDGHQKQMQKEAALNKRGAVAMGFDQDATVHHFQLAEDGGSIEVSVKDAADAKSLEAIRGHLKEIAIAFGHGDFSKPVRTHAELPPGAEEMKALTDEITYTYEETASGGRVRIRASKGDAVTAVHSFLKYQISEHHTSGH